ncbi:MAG: SPOR domain-containing protein [Acidobacteria bacterium]|nr:SPOR domain-containing protein [Acidobacteriota bacterium]
MRSKLDTGKALVLYGFATAFLLGAFLTGLYLGKSQTDMPVQAEDKTPTTLAPVEDPKPKLEFYEGVLNPDPDGDAPSTPPQGETGEVSVEPEETSPDTDPGTEVFTIQVAALRTESEARQMMLRLEAKGFPGSVQAPSPGNDAFYRVYVGEFMSMTEAREMESKLRENAFPTFVRPLETPSPKKGVKH